MSAFNGVHNQAGSFDAQEESGAIAYYSYIQALEDVKAERNRNNYLAEQKADEQAFKFAQYQANVKKIPAEEKRSRLTTLLEPMQMLMQELLDQFKKIFKKHDESTRSMIKKLKTLAKGLDIDEAKVDEFVNKVDEEVARALPVHNPIAATSAPAFDPMMEASAPPLPVPVPTASRKVIDPTTELGFSVLESKKAVEAKQKQQKDIFSQVFDMVFGSLFKRKEERSDFYAEAINDFKAKASEVVAARINQQLEVRNLLSHYSGEADYSAMKAFVKNF